MGKDRVQNSRYFADLDMKYHSSWKWLMPVVEKINTIDGIRVLISPAIVTILKDDSTTFSINEKVNVKLIKSIWLAVIEFIKWYNKELVKNG